MDLRNPIFIVGPGRSGTTLLRSILSAHSRISITPETQFMKWIDEQWGVRGTPDNFDSFWNKYTNWVRFQDLDIDPDYCRELLEESDHSFQSVFRVILSAYAERVQVPRVGEKSPSHVHYLPLLLDWFPDARILITMRDPRAVVASQLRTPYVTEKIKPLSVRTGVFLAKRRRELIRYAEDWAHIFEDIAPRWSKDNRVRIISYEALVQHPEAQVRSICIFLGEDYEPAMLSERTSSSVPPPAGVAPDKQLEEWRRKHYAKSRAPISSDSLDKWKRRLAPMETAIIEQRCLRGMQANGYSVSVTNAMRLQAKLLSDGFLKAHYAESVSRNFARRIRRRIRAMTH